VAERDPDRGIIETGIKIAEVRRARRLTQVELAKRLGLSRKYVAQIEQGRKVVSLWRLFQFAQALEVTASGLVSRPKRKEGFPVGRPAPPDAAYRGSQFVGVYWRSGAWYGKVWHEGKNHVVGKFDEEEDAARARDRLAKKLKGKRARLNFPT
jgi:transcriptional regulator with XRE-family HTH domain